MDNNIRFCLVKNHGTWFVKIRDGHKQALLSTGVKVTGKNDREIEHSRQQAMLKLNDVIEKYSTSQKNKESESASANEALTESENPSFAEYMENYNQNQRDGREIRITTYDDRKQKIEKHIKPYFGNMKIKDMVKDDFKRYKVAKLNEGLSANTVGKLLTFMKTVLDDAIDNHIISENPAAKVKKPKKEKYKPVILSPKQLLLLLNGVKGTDMELPIMLAVFFALRRSEIIGIRWSNFDFIKMMLSITGTVTRQHNAEGKLLDVYSTDTKTEGSKSVYLLTSDVATYFKTKFIEQQEMPRETNDYVDFVCVDNVGQRLKLDYVSSKFSKLLKKLGLPHVRLHDLRHSTLSLLSSQNVPMKDIQAYARHDQFETTADTYTHPVEDSTLYLLDTIVKTIGFSSDTEISYKSDEKQIEISQPKKNHLWGKDAYSQLTDMNNMISGLV